MYFLKHSAVRLLDENDIKSNKGSRISGHVILRLLNRLSETIQNTSLLHFVLF